jgi:predicted transcriptional regulator
MNPACVSLRKEERRIVDLYSYLLSREEIRAEEDRRSIEREYHNKFDAVLKEGEKKGCF